MVTVVLLTALWAKGCCFEVYARVSSLAAQRARRALCARLHTITKVIMIGFREVLEKR